MGRSLERLTPRLAGRPLEVSLSAPPVEVDPTFLDEAVTNIIENALKYTPAGTPLRITATGSEAPGRIRLTIEDGGAGVPEETLPRLFEKFYRVPGSGRGSRSGTGIGLAVVRGLVEAMGGAVRARRSELGGLAVDIDLVAATVPAELLDGCRHVTTRRPQRPRVLLVEDDPETRAALVRELTARGYLVDPATDGRSALERWEAARPDVILLDLGLPDMDGLSVITRVRRDALTPIVILSGRYEEREKVAALERGADDYVTKPFGVEELNARLRVALRHGAGPASKSGRSHRRGTTGIRWPPPRSRAWRVSCSS